mmetsp:Transcript_12651/g.21289  ORF Transcript_12651/g.21289 Transcript_12651/m.21289 type:complete len:146 (+) Transcript_12651:539-976(+)
MGSQVMIGKEKDREGSVDANSTYNKGNLRSQGTMQQSRKENSDQKEKNFMSAQNERGNSIGLNEYNTEKQASQDGAASLNVNQANQISPRTGTSKNLEKMNVMNFIKQISQAEKGSRENRFMGQLDRDNPEYQKAINRQGSKKLI